MKLKAVYRGWLEERRLSGMTPLSNDAHIHIAALIERYEAAQHGVQRTDEACAAERHDYYNALLAYVFCPYCGERLLSR